MSKKFLLVIISFLFTTITQAQELFSKVELSKNALDSETIGIVDNQENVNLINIGLTTIFHSKYNEAGTLLFQKKYSRPNYIYSSTQGYSINEDNSIILYFSNGKNKLFGNITLPQDADAKPIYSEFTVNGKKEKFLVAINDSGLFYIYTYLKNTSILKRYTVSKEIKEVIDFNLTKERFYNFKNEIAPLSEVLDPWNVTLIESNVPNSIDIASEKIKLYIKGNEHIFTMNHRKIATRTIRLNKHSNEVSIGYYNMPARLFSLNEGLRSNSFIFKDCVYQFICSKQRLNLSAYDLETKELIKEYNFDKNDDLTIKNEALKQEGGTYAFGGKRNLEKTSQFLRKISKSQDVGIYIFQKDNRLNLSMGGKIAINHGSPISGGFGNPATGGISVGAYASYSTTRSVFINCLFDPKTFEHLEGQLDKNIFDRISEHADFLKESNQVKKLKLESVFKYKDTFMQGYYDKKKEIYYLKKYKI